MVPTSEEEFLCLTFTHKEYSSWVVGQLTGGNVWDFGVQRTTNFMASFFLSFKSGFIIAFCIWEYFFSPQLDVFGLWVSDSLASPVVFKGPPGMTFWRTSFRFYVCEYICKNLHSLLLFAMLPLYKITTM